MPDSASSPFSSGSYQDGSSPPSPVLDVAPSRRIPIASVRCASGESAPRLIAELTNRRTISVAGSTAASATRRRRRSCSMSRTSAGSERLRAAR